MEDSLDIRLLIEKFERNEFVYDDVQWLSDEQRHTLAQTLLSLICLNEATFDRGMMVLKYLIPHLSSDKRLEIIEGMVQVTHDLNKFDGEETFSFLDEIVLSSLTSSQRVILAEHLSKYLKPDHVLSCEAALWALSRIIPCLHSVNRKNCLADVLMLVRQGIHKDTVLQMLTTVVTSVKRDERIDVAHFIGESLKANESSMLKVFIIDFLKQIMAAIPDRDREGLADCVAPLIYNTDLGVVRKALEYFQHNLKVIPADQRYSYILMMIGLVHDASLQSEVFEALEANLAHLEHEEEREHVTTVLTQFGGASLKQEEATEELGEISISLVREN